MEQVRSTDGTLTVSRKPITGFRQAEDDNTCPCYIKGSELQYIIDSKTREVKGFKAEIGRIYTIQYYTPTKITKAIKKLFTVRYDENPNFYECTVIVNEDE